MSRCVSAAMQETKMSTARPEVSGRKAGAGPATKTTKKTPKSTEERDAYSVPEFCRRHNISNGTYYRLRIEGLGPKEARALGRVLITKEAAEAFRLKDEETTETAV